MVAVTCPSRSGKMPLSGRAAATASARRKFTLQDTLRRAQTCALACSPTGKSIESGIVPPTSPPVTGRVKEGGAVSCGLVAREQELTLLDEILERAVSYQAPQ